MNECRCRDTNMWWTGAGVVTTANGTNATGGDTAAAAAAAVAGGAAADGGADARKYATATATSLRAAIAFPDWRKLIQSKMHK